MNRFGLWLSKELKRVGKNQTALAHALGVSRQAINYYVMDEKDRRPDDEMLREIAKFLKISPEAVYRGIGILPEETQDPWVKEMSYKIDKLPASLRPIAETLLDSLLEQEEKMTAAKARKKIITNEK